MLLGVVGLQRRRRAKRKKHSTGMGSLVPGWGAFVALAAARGAYQATFMMINVCLARFEPQTWCRMLTTAKATTSRMSFGLR